MLEETEMYGALTELRDAGLDQPSYDEVDARCRAVLQQEIDREQAAGRRRWSYRRIPWRVALPLALVLVGSVGAVGYAALSSPSELSAGIACHADGSLNGSSTVVGVDGRAATATCAQLWARGEVADGASAAPAPLHACVDPKGGGAIHVFATADNGICARVGLTEDQSAAANSEARRYAGFSRDLLAKLDRVDCPTDSQMQTMIRDSLTSAGLSGWTIKDAGGYNAGRPCASLALDSDARVATISAIAP